MGRVEPLMEAPDGCLLRASSAKQLFEHGDKPLSKRAKRTIFPVLGT